MFLSEIKGEYIMKYMLKNAYIKKDYDLPAVSYTHLTLPTKAKG